MIVQITNTMKQKCYDFASNIILGDNQFNRLPNSLDKRIERTFVGKLSELAFLKFLQDNGINYPEGDMFTIYNGQENVDGFDFITTSNQTIDIKCASKPYHTRIMVPLDQFINIPKDIYIGIKLNSSVNPITDLISIDSINKAIIKGFCTYDELSLQTTKDFGEGKCKPYRINDLNSDISLILCDF